MFTFEDKVAHNLYAAGWFYLSPCEIRGADNSSTCAVMTEKSYWWNSYF